ncbi:polysaccharide deacetylase family protein [Alkalibacter rhizosphaerae]|uniref:Polysaccharide deacetylase family protein n=1 Tax=Alkalibacter rhizosphaerae TaxID=2815577 RepID=A0A974XFT3_9FIRM|nr:polysaccharide deacetylase family protein [Alkalibacter rhizosphaerae]QSX07835.1 polysaccharide deacetylase family protein [Alkalibacter rhizosphaerae]
MNWIKWTVGLIAGAFVIYDLLPDLLAHRLGIGAWKRHYGAGVVLTFDDGPDPRYTPDFLDFLQERSIPACFFVVAKDGLEHKNILLRMKEEGHQIGCHGWMHRHGWSRSPWKTWREWTRAVEALEKILDQEILYVRAPWGAVNLALMVWCKAKGKHLIGWTAKGWDWKNKRRPEEIVSDLLKKADHGTILLLHDGGGEAGAPKNTLEALPLLAKGVLEEIKVPFVPLELSDWTWRKRIGFRLWEQWEAFYAKHNQVERISFQNAFRIAQGVYEGPDLMGEDGNLVARRGDRAGMIHLENIHFQKFGTDPKRIALRSIRLVRNSMKELAVFSATDPRYKDVDVFVGLTLLSRGVKGVGFHVEEDSAPPSKVIGWIQQMVYRVYNPANLKHTGENESTPKVVWISRQELMDKYLPSSGDVHAQDLS